MNATRFAMGAFRLPPKYDEVSVCPQLNHYNTQSSQDKFGLMVYLDYKPTRHAIPAKRFTLARGSVELMEDVSIC